MPYERWLLAIASRWRTLTGRRQLERDLDDELSDHVARETARLLSAGLPADEATRRARRTLGTPAQIKEWCRDASGVTAIDSLAQDLRYGGRVLRQNPAFTLVAVLTLALGLGANTAVFSLVDGILLAELPYPAPNRLVSVVATYPNGAFAALRDTTRAMTVGAYAEGHWVTLSGQGEPTRLSETKVSAELFSLLGVEPALGRGFAPRRDRASDRVAILGHDLWERQFHGDRSIVGRFVQLDGVPFEVVGVMPQWFRFPSRRTQLWVPLGLDAADVPHYWAGDFMPIVGRLRPGRSIAEAEAEVRVFQGRIRSAFPWPMPASWNEDLTVVPLREALVGDVRPRLLILFAAVLLVLVIACANVANLSLARAAARQREIGVRAALGAGPRRIARQLLTESVLLAAIGAAAGLLVATQLLAVLRLVLPPDTPRLAEVHMNWRVLAFTALLAIASGCAFALAPVVQTLGLGLRPALEAGGRGASRAIAGRIRAALTVAQVAGAVLLVIAAGLLVRSLWTLSHVDPGFEASGLLTARVSPPPSLCATPDRCLTFYRSLEDQVRAEPGVGAAALVNTLPLTGALAKRSIQLEGYVPAGDAGAPLVWLHVVTPGYFDAMRIRLESGRAFTRSDVGSTPVAIVPAAMARRFWPGQNPIGRHVRFVGEARWRTIVGVVADVRGYDLTQAVPGWMAGALYVPHDTGATLEDGHLPPDMVLVIRSNANATLTGDALRRVTRRVTSGVAISDVRTMANVVADSAAAPAATTSLLVTMAGLALVLGCVGVYGVLSFLVSRQTRDLAIRMALGAQRGDVFWLVIREGATLCAVGIALGVAGAFGITRWLASELYGVSPTDPTTYAAVTLLVGAVTLTACYVPTRRAMAVDPQSVLRDQ